MTKLGLNLSASVMSKLEKGKWTPLRRCDVTESIEYLKNHGFETHALAEQALSNLLGIEFDLPDGGVSWVAFDTKGAIQFLSPSGLAGVENLVAESLCPIGHGGGFVVLLAPSGRAFLLQDEFLCLLSAESLSDLLEFVFTGNRSLCQEILLPE